MDAMNKALLLVIFATLSSVEHIQARHYLVKMEPKADPEPQQEKEAEARGSTKTTSYSTPQKREPATFSRNTTTSNYTEDYPCERRLYGRYEGDGCRIVKTLTDIATWRECAVECNKLNMYPSIHSCTRWSMKTEDPDMHSYVCVLMNWVWQPEDSTCTIQSNALWQSGTSECGKDWMG